MRGFRYISKRFLTRIFNSLQIRNCGIIIRLSSCQICLSFCISRIRGCLSKFIGGICGNALQFFELCFRRLQSHGDLAGIGVRVKAQHRQRLVIGLAELCHVPVFRGVGIGGLNKALLIGQLHVAQGLLGGFQLLAVRRLQDKEHISRRDVIAHLHHDAADLPRLIDGDVIRLVRRHCGGTADLGIDGAGFHILRRHLGKRAVHDGIGEKGEHEKNRQKNDGKGLDPFPSFCSLHRVSYLSWWFGAWRRSSTRLEFSPSPNRSGRCLPPGIPHRGGRGEGRGSCR